MTIGLADRPRRRVGLHEVIIDRQATIYTRTAVHRLDELGTALWNCMDGTVTVGALVGDLCAMSLEDPVQIEHDVTALIRELEVLGLVELVKGRENSGRERPAAGPAAGEAVPERNFFAYRLPGPIDMPLEPAPRKREWMEATDERFANRCLPLLIANQAGWIVRSSHTILATWDGGGGKENLDVEVLRGSGPCPTVSHFGYGILTWCIPYLFRTPAGFNLLIRGPVNEPRDGAQALEGVVETDWTSASATMNWKLTRPGLTVRFDVGDAICMIVPQRRGDLEDLVPRMEPLESDPELHVSHRSWQSSRSFFLEGLANGHDGSGNTGWQKHYFHGSSPGGRQAPEHQRRLHLRPFSTTE